MPTCGTRNQGGRSLSCYNQSTASNRGSTQYCLQVIVPLVYRPAIKSAMLAAPFTSPLAQLLRE